MNLPIPYLESHFDRFLQELVQLSKIPSVSFPGYPPEALEQSAEWTAKRMKEVGLENVEILRIPGAHPYIYGDWLHAEEKPIVLLYGHHDVQPPGRSDYWKNAPFEPTLREDNRLYGRGVVDDKAGVLLHLNAIEAYLKTAGKLPLNVRFIVEGEEETGSEHLGVFLNQYKNKLKSDVMVLTDTGNLEEGLPSITYRLRGIVDAIVEVRTLDHPVHSGMWGGPVVDAVTVLNKILSRLTNQDGTIAIPNFYEDVPKPDLHEKALLEKLPLDEKRFRKELQSVDSLEWIGNRQLSLYEKIWCYPSINILGIDAPSVEKTSNQIVEFARAKVSIRIVAGQNPKKCLTQLCHFLTQNPPFGAEVKVIEGAAGEPWRVEPKGAAFDAASRALEKGFEREAVFIGCGASIPFVKPFTETFGNIPALLIGIEDPICNAHGENESLSISDWKKGMKAAVYLYEELGKLRR